MNLTRSMSAVRHCESPGRWKSRRRPPGRGLRWRRVVAVSRWARFVHPRPGDRCHEPRDLCSAPTAGAVARFYVELVFGADAFSLGLGDPPGHHRRVRPGVEGCPIALQFGVTSGDDRLGTPGPGRRPPWSRCSRHGEVDDVSWWLWLSDGLAGSHPRRRSRCASCRSRRWLSGLLSCSRAWRVGRCPCGLCRNVRMRSTMVAMLVSFLSWIFVPAGVRSPESDGGGDGYAANRRPTLTRVAASLIAVITVPIHAPRIGARSAARSESWQPGCPRRSSTRPGQAVRAADPGGARQGTGHLAGGACCGPRRRCGGRVCRCVSGAIEGHDIPLGLGRCGWHLRSGMSSIPG